MSEKKLNRREQIRKVLTIFKVGDRYFPHVFYQKLIIFILSEILVCIAGIFYAAGNMLGWLLMFIGLGVMVYIIVVVTLEDRRRQRSRKEEVTGNLSLS